MSPKDTIARTLGLFAAFLFTLSCEGDYSTEECLTPAGIHKLMLDC